MTKRQPTLLDAWGEPPIKLREESDSERQEESKAEEPETVSDSEVQDQGAQSDSSLWVLPSVQHCVVTTHTVFSASEQVSFTLQSRASIAFMMLQFESLSNNVLANQNYPGIDPVQLDFRNGVTLTNFQLHEPTTTSLKHVTSSAAVLF